LIAAQSPGTLLSSRVPVDFGFDSARRIMPAEHPNRGSFCFSSDHRYASAQTAESPARSFRRVYRIDQQEGLTEWSTIRKALIGWHQNPPELRARVVWKEEIGPLAGCHDHRRLAGASIRLTNLSDAIGFQGTAAAVATGSLGDRIRDRGSRQGAVLDQGSRER